MQDTNKPSVQTEPSANNDMSQNTEPSSAQAVANQASQEQQPAQNQYQGWNNAQGGSAQQAAQSADNVQQQAQANGQYQAQNNAQAQYYGQGQANAQTFGQPSSQATGGAASQAQPQPIYFAQASAAAGQYQGQGAAANGQYPGQAQWHGQYQGQSAMHNQQSNGHGFEQQGNANQYHGAQGQNQAYYQGANAQQGGAQYNAQQQAGANTSSGAAGTNTAAGAPSANTAAGAAGARGEAGAGLNAAGVSDAGKQGVIESVFGKEWTSNLSTHILMVAVISLLLLIPSLFFNMVLDDRKGSQSYAIDSIVEPWGYDQMLGDPIALVSLQLEGAVKKKRRNEDEEVIIDFEERTYMAIAKRSDSLVEPEFETRYRGNYEATLYKAKVVQEGFIDAGTAISDIVSEQSARKVAVTSFKIVVPVKYYKSIDEIKSITINGKQYEPESISHSDINGFGVSLSEGDLAEILKGSNITPMFDHMPKGSRSSEVLSNIPALRNTFDADKERVNEDQSAAATLGRITKATDPGMLRYRVEYVLRGSQSLNFRPLGQITRTEFKGKWDTPSYTGSFLPSERSSKNDGDGKFFSAVYHQNNIATGLPMTFNVQKIDLFSRSDCYILDFSNSITFYTLIDRLTKYVLLFICMTFVTVLTCEIVMGRMVSLAQYVVIGVALIMFYMVLLALSEHTSFTFAYICASLLMSVMISLYLKAALNSKRSAAAVCIMLLAMYAVLFAIVHIEAYALLVGTILLVLMLGIVMFITRRINTKMNF